MLNKSHKIYKFVVFKLPLETTYITFIFLIRVVLILWDYILWLVFYTFLEFLNFEIKSFVKGIGIKKK